MNKKVSFLLRSVLTILSVTVVCSFIYTFSQEYIINYYKSAPGDIFSGSMDVSEIIAFENGKSLVLGTFLQNDDLLTEPSLFIKSYNEKGDFNEAGSIELPYGYSQSRVLRLSDRIFILYEAENASSSGAYVYEISSDAKLLSKKVLIHPNPEFDAENKQYFIAHDGVRFIYAIKVKSDLYFYDISDTLLCTAPILADAEVKSIDASTNKYTIVGSITSEGSYTAYYAAYSRSGEQLYSQSLGQIITAAENTEASEIITTSVCTDIIRTSPDPDSNIFICGYYFDHRSYIDKYYKDGTSVGRAELFALANESITRRTSHGSVLLASDYFTSPWCSFFILKIDKDGTVINSLSPLENSSSRGIASVSVLNAIGSVKDNGDEKALCTLVSSMANSASDESYRTEIYNLYPDMTLSPSASIFLSSDISAYYTTASDGKLLVYTAINGINEYTMHIYKDTSEYAAGQNKLELCRKAAGYIKALMDSLPMFIIFIVLAVTLRYSYFDYIIKKELFAKDTD